VEGAFEVVVIKNFRQLYIILASERPNMTKQPEKRTLPQGRLRPKEYSDPANKSVAGLLLNLVAAAIPDETGSSRSMGW
jgi:hypothetical protein